MTTDDKSVRGVLFGMFFVGWRRWSFVNNKFWFDENKMKEMLRHWEGNVKTLGKKC